MVTVQIIKKIIFSYYVLIAILLQKTLEVETKIVQELIKDKDEFESRLSLQ